MTRDEFLAQDAPVSDGVHYLTDVNVAKAHVLLRLMELLPAASRALPNISR